MFLLAVGGETSGNRKRSWKGLGGRGKGQRESQCSICTQRSGLQQESAGEENRGFWLGLKVKKDTHSWKDRRGVLSAAGWKPCLYNLQDKQMSGGHPVAINDVASPCWMGGQFRSFNLWRPRGPG